MLIGDSVICDGRAYTVVGFTPASVEPAQAQLLDSRYGLDSLGRPAISQPATIGGTRSALRREGRSASREIGDGPRGESTTATAATPKRRYEGHHSTFVRPELCHAFPRPQVSGNRSAGLVPPRYLVLPLTIRIRGPLPVKSVFSAALSEKWTERCFRPNRLRLSPTRGTARIATDRMLETVATLPGHFRPTRTQLTRAGRPTSGFSHLS